MDVREKLVELLDNSFEKQSEKRGLLTAPHTADDLIANGVTVQEWISVKDRLPEKTGRYLTTNKRANDEICVFDLWFDCGEWYIDENDDEFIYKVTHWMPLPEPPEKGD